MSLEAYESSFGLDAARMMNEFQEDFGGDSLEDLVLLDSMDGLGQMGNPGRMGTDEHTGPPVRNESRDSRCGCRWGVRAGWRRLGAC